MFTGTTNNSLIIVALLTIEKTGIPVLTSVAPLATSRHNTKYQMTERQFKIKIGTLRRIKNDLEYYVKEYATQQLKIDKMRLDGKNEYDVHKQEEVLVETETMLPDCQSRLQEALNDVSSFIETYRDEVESFEGFQEAQALLAAIPTLFH